MLSAATITFTGGGDGISWEDPANWDTGTVPTFVDDVILNGTDVVQLNQAGLAINSLEMYNQSQLTIMGTGSLSLNLNTDNGSHVKLYNRANLIINGSLTSLNSPDRGFETFNQSIITNNGLVIVSGTDSDCIEANDNSTAVNNGQWFMSDINSNGTDLDDSSQFINNGSMNLNDINSDGLEMDGTADFYNYGNIDINDTTSDGICMDGTGTRFYNYGTINISDASSQNAVEVERGYFYNEAGAILNLFNLTNDGVTLQTNGRMDNNGIINIDVLVNSSDDNGVEVESDARLRNYNIININQSNSMASAIEMDGSNGRLLNEDCGVINITSANEIEVAASNLLRNRGVLATVFGGTNTNDGTINNQNVITAPNGFTAAPNPVVGPGSINMAGAVPAQSACNILIGSIGCSGTTTYNPAQDMYTQTADGCFYAGNYTTDQISYSFQELCGNGEIIARVAGFIGQGWAGVMMREDLSAGSKKISLMVNQSEVARREVRMSTNGPAFPQQFPAFGYDWVRIVRNGNYFQGFVSQNGVQWQFVMNQYIPMANCINIGLVSTNYNDNNSTSIAMFDNVFFSNAPLMVEEVDTEINVNLNEDSKFSVFPNPTNGKVTLTLDATLDQEFELSIMNAIGQQVRVLNVIPAETPRQDVDLSGLPNGLYYFNLMDTNGNRQTQKVIKQ